MSIRYPGGKEYTPADSVEIKPTKPNKYHAKKTVVDGHVFDSKRESERYIELRTLQDAGEITHLALQVRFSIILKNKVICKYYADFQYIDKNGFRVIEDVKGFRTGEYKLKKKLVEVMYGIEITEVE